MSINIMIVDDEPVTREMLTEILEKHNFSADSFDSGPNALKSFRPKKYSLILSDYYMDEMNGDDFLKEIRKLDKEIPFIIVTTNTDLEKAIQLMKDGANDYVAKPFIEEDLLFRIIKNLESSDNRRVIERVRKEQKVKELYNSSLINWKTLYATKDLSQVNKFISIFTRTINQAGGFLWLELLKSQLERIDDDYSRLPTPIADLIISTSENNKQFFENISTISDLEERNYKNEKIKLSELFSRIASYIKEDLKPLSDRYNRAFSINDYNHKLDGYIELDIDSLFQVINELYVNALKYSPKGSPIALMIDRETLKNEPLIDISVINYPRRMVAETIEGLPIIGIPEEYSELVFDLFYTIENFPTPLEEELWTNGTGLYICRKILSKMGGWLTNSNGLDYTKGEPVNYLKFKITLPYSH